MSAQSVATSVEVRVISDNNTMSNELDNEYPDTKPPSNFLNSRGNESSGTRQRRKARSTRRRLNAMINNTSLHFSDTDSEGELAVPRAVAPNGVTSKIVTSGPTSLLQPVISVTLDGSGDDSSVGGGGGGERRGSFMENLTDVDEIYPSDSEADGARRSRRASLAVNSGIVQGETDLEDISNDEDEVTDAPIYVKPRNDILVDFNGETITTKEGDGPFSVEIRNQMSVDDGWQDEAAAAAAANAPDITVVPTTDSEDMEASDDDDGLEGACGLPTYEDLDILAASQIVMRHSSKKEQQPPQLLTVAEPDDGASEGHTDVEDIE